MVNETWMVQSCICCLFCYLRRSGIYIFPFCSDSWRSHSHCLCNNWSQKILQTRPRSTIYERPGCYSPSYAVLPALRGAMEPHGTRTWVRQLLPGDQDHHVRNRKPNNTKYDGPRKQTPFPSSLPNTGASSEPPNPRQPGRGRSPHDPSKCP